MSVTVEAPRRRGLRVRFTDRTNASTPWHVSSKEALLWIAATGLLIALALYYPALRGDPVLDDHSLPLTSGGWPPLSGWLQGQRPLLMLSYHLNAFFLGTTAAGFHVVNLLIHLINTCAVFLILR